MSWDCTILHPDTPVVLGQWNSWPRAGLVPLGSAANVRELIHAVIPQGHWSHEREVSVQTNGGGSLLIELRTDRRDGMIDAAYSPERLSDPNDTERAEIDTFTPLPDEPVTSLSVEARHGGDPITPLHEICRKGNWVMLDHQTSKRLTVQEFSGAFASFEDFVGFVRQVMRGRSV